ncbi:uncharacterized protein LOC119943978 [Tachyglossus aculeatus]|uniref:uncharacterized protein LOC119943978 n=1 Tax=Tachyglossus aculeatus TaxID=9261 RepID=UPI0018F2982D|nr:uncharacterized protein LOC119943978 [Tachyglossus aculeatus]
MPSILRDISIPLVVLCFVGASITISILITYSLDWRVWQYDNPNITTIWLGLSKYCYLPKDPAKLSRILEKVCIKMNATLEFPWEITLSQDWMSLATVMQGAALLFTFFGILTVLKKEVHAPFYPWFQVAGICLMLGSIIVLGTVSWNFYLDSVNHPFNYPTNFLLLDIPMHRNMGAATPLGITASFLMLPNGIMLLIHGCRLRPDSRVHPLEF